MISLDSNNYIFSLYKGDTNKITFNCNIGSIKSPNYYELKENDRVYFGLMESNQKFEDALIKEVIDYKTYKLCNNEYIITLSHEDTAHLHTGTYYYSIKLYVEKDSENGNNESIYTIVPKTKLFILE